MIKLENTSVMNFENAIRGARNPMNSWDKLDSSFDANGNFVFGPNDLSLGRKLCKAGSDHRKFVRQIFISVDITAPIYWWKEFDTYKVGTASNSCSTMHKIDAYPFTIDMFSCEEMTNKSLDALKVTIEALNEYRDEYNRVKDDTTDEGKAYAKKIWAQLIQLLPSSFNQKRTVDFTYEVATNIYTWRHNHKLVEWRILCNVLANLPYGRDIIIPTMLQRNNGN